MNVPTRIQRSRKAGSTTPEGTKYCGRPGRWGNPFVVNRHDANYYRVAVNAKSGVAFLVRMLTAAGPAGFKTKAEAQAHAVMLFGCLLREAPWAYPVQELAGYEYLSCWCKAGEPCHVDEIIKAIKKQQQ